MLKEVKNIIFLGVPLKMVLQLLLRELGIHQQQYEFTRFASQSATKRIAHLFTNSSRSISSRINIDEVHSGAFQPLPAGGLLRREELTPTSELDKVKTGC